MPRVLPWKPIAILTTISTILLSLLLLPACCCVKGPLAPISPAAAPVIAPIGAGAMPTPSEAAAKAPTQAFMRNVWFHIDQDAFLDIHTMRGEMVSNTPGAPLNFDNKLSFVMKVDTATIGVNAATLDILLNRYVFAYPNSPLRNLRSEMAGKQLRQTGIIHKVVDIPFTMLADVSVSHGLLRIHPAKLDICGINGLGLLKAVGMTLQKMLNLPRERGLSAAGNDLMLDPMRALPPPKAELHLVDARVQGDEMLLMFDAGRHLAELVIPHAEEKNTMMFRGGTLRIGKLLMVDAEMQVADSDPSDPFDFYIDRYNEQLVAGFSRNQPDYGLLVYMRDFNDLGKPPRPGEKLAP
ncbi:MAG TPA: hypothetical protein VGQ46_15285 [Thermoanaerobaculia bacterium]|jgi:hypothetical protein|nr:hypothetical protein [Thermoanaerobaculia bacterium]